MPEPASSAASSRPRIAIAHDYLVQRGGAERVVLSMVKAFPEASVHTLLFDPDTTFAEFRDVEVVPSPLNRVRPLRHRRSVMPLLPIAAPRVRVDADVVLASSSGWAHAFDITGRTIVYCHSPARWLYQAESYLGDASRWAPQRIGLRLLEDPLRRWDRRHAQRADAYLANSRIVQSRIADTYGRRAEVVPPPHSVDVDGPQERPAALDDWTDRGYHLVVSRLMPYKNVDRVIEAFHDLPGERLVIVGRGPERDRLAARLGPDMRMLQDLSDAELRWVYAHADRLVAASHEDYGLTPLEAGAFGVPTLALRGGGYLDTVHEGVSGLFFDDATADAVRGAVLADRAHDWDAQAVRAHAARFSEDAFIERLRAWVGAVADGRAPD